MKEYLENILKGLIAGIFSAYLIIYALRPAVPYPELILEIFENKWMFLILLIINYYVFVWDYTSGAILLLCVIALVFDYIVFTEKGFKKVVTVEKFSYTTDKADKAENVDKADKAENVDKADKPSNNNANGGGKGGSIMDKLLEMQKFEFNIRNIKL